MQDRIEQIFWTLLHAGLSCSDCNLVGYGSVSDDEWQKIYDLSSEQGVAGILFSAVERLPKNQVPNIDILMDWLGQTEYIKSQNEEYCKNSEEFLALVRGEGLEVRVLKGFECAKYYPQPERRALGDLDIYLLENNEKPQMGGHEWAYEEGNRLASSLGAVVDLHDYKHSHITWKGLTIENHRLLTTARGSSVKKEFEKYLQSIIPSKQFEALFLTVHGFQHFMAEGLSIRHICDWGMFVKNCQKEVDWKDYFDWMDKLGTYRFAVTMNFIVERYLGISCETRLGDSSEGQLEDWSRMVLDDAFSRRESLDSMNIGIVKYRVLQLKYALQQSWKYRVFKNENVLVAYIKMIWQHWFDRV